MQTFKVVTSVMKSGVMFYATANIRALNYDRALIKARKWCYENKVTLESVINTSKQL